MNEQEARINAIRKRWQHAWKPCASDFADDVLFLLSVIDAATPPTGHIIDDKGVVRKVRMQAVFVGGTLPCAIPLKPGETVMAVEPAAEAARKEGGT